MCAIEMFEEVVVAKDVNEVIHAGMKGIVMECDAEEAEVMFTSSTGSTYSLHGETCFHIPLDLLQHCSV